MENVDERQEQISIIKFLIAVYENVELLVFKRFMKKLSPMSFSTHVILSKKVTIRLFFVLYLLLLLKFGLDTIRGQILNTYYVYNLRINT